MVMPNISEGIAAAFPQEDLLSGEEEPLEAIPSARQHQPKNENWTGSRLSIRHEFWWHMLPGAARKAARGRHDKRVGDSGEEIWIHMRPDKDTMEEHSANSRGRRTTDDNGNRA